MKVFGEGIGYRLGFVKVVHGRQVLAPLRIAPDFDESGTHHDAKEVPTDSPRNNGRDRNVGLLFPERH